MRKYNLIVVGGGLTGVCASIAAAREGLDVLLIEKSGVLGGAMSNSLVYPFMSYWTFDIESKTKKYLSGGIFREMLNIQEEQFQNSSDIFFSPQNF